MFGRRSAPASSGSGATQVGAEDASGAPSTVGKGRPTPKRREAEAARRARSTPPKDRKQARQRLRGEQRRERDEQTAALRAGDERLYPARDRGPARRVARNYVDGRRGFGELFWPVVIAAVVMLLLPRIQSVATLVLLTFYVLIIGDSAIMLLGLNRLLSRVAPNDPARKGTLPYAFARSLQRRKRRLPVVKAPIGWSRRARGGEVDPLAEPKR